MKMKFKKEVKAMFKEKAMRGLVCLLAIMLASKGWAVAKEATQGTEAAKAIGTQTRVGTISKTSLWGVRAEDLKVKEIRKLIPPEPKLEGWIPSPDGKKKAKIEKNQIIILDTSKKGTPTEIRIEQEKQINRIFWVPDSRKIAYIAGNELWTMDIKTKKEMKIARLEVSYIEVSPNGKDVAYNTSDDKGQKVEVADLITGRKWVLGEGKIDGLFWFAGGEKIMIKFLTEGYYTYTMKTNKDGSEKVIFDSKYKVLSPDGKKIAYVDRYPQLWLMDLETGEKKMLTQWGLRPSWSPDGKKILYDT